LGEREFWERWKLLLGKRIGKIQVTRQNLRACEIERSGF